MFVGVFIGSFFWGAVADTIGRKKVEHPLHVYICNAFDNLIRQDSERKTIREILCTETCGVIAAYTTLH